MMMTSISAYLLGALAMLAAEGILFFVTMTIAVVIAAVSSAKRTKHTDP